MAKKGLFVWLFSSITFVSLLHFMDAVSAILFSGQIHFLQLYPLIGEKLQAIPLTTYFWISGGASLIFWGMTCAIAFENPVEHFLNIMLSDARKQSTIETQVVEEKSDVLDAMIETVESSNELLGHVKDMVYNVRTEVREIKPLNENVQNIRTELNSLKKEVKKLDEKTRFPILCRTCGKPLQSEFRLCPYCGESIRLLNEKPISLHEYR